MSPHINHLHPLSKGDNKKKKTGPGMEGPVTYEFKVLWSKVRW